MQVILLSGVISKIALFIIRMWVYWKPQDSKVGWISTASAQEEFGVCSNLCNKTLTWTKGPNKKDQKVDDVISNQLINLKKSSSITKKNNDSNLCNNGIQGCDSSDPIKCIARYVS
eukprot:TRINITY_DN4357_c0_g4_i4.p3 TRINITY_DN4357_c0_g4~~TRINITY_DN4357_c0_g4_i4.p3  ORF type:complete len:116 (-),score=6.00 TRINITY_DN4357_c0_g4_i4:213-560(-)